VIGTIAAIPAVAPLTAWITFSDMVSKALERTGIANSEKEA
jgi:hypothetical protein